MRLRLTSWPHRHARASDGKTHVKVFDFVDYGKYVAKHSRKRARTYERESAYVVVPITLAELSNMIA